MEQETQSHSASPHTHHQAKPRVYSDEEWEAQKSNFERLYKDNSLKDVIAAMKHDHGFVATERQYKRRIEKWGLQKNVRGVEMLTIAAQQVKRKLETGKESNFSVRGREVREDKIARYLKRKNVHDSDLISHEIPAENPGNEIMCYTPPHEISRCEQPVPIKSLVQYGSNHADLIIQSMDHMQDDQDRTNLLKRFVPSEDEFRAVYSPIPIRQSGNIHQLQLNLTHTIPLPFLGNIRSIEEETTPSPSPSLSSAASEVLVAISPLLRPSLVSTSPPSAALLENNSRKYLELYGTRDYGTCIASRTSRSFTYSSAVGSKSNRNNQPRGIQGFRNSPYSPHI